MQRLLLRLPISQLRTRALSRAALSNATHRNGQARLLNLPAELRNTIYQLTVTSSKPIHASCSATQVLGSKIYQCRFSIPPLLEVSQQIRSEAISLYFSTNVFRLNIPLNTPRSKRSFPISFGPLRRYLRSIEKWEIDNVWTLWRINLTTGLASASITFEDQCGIVRLSETRSILRVSKSSDSIPLLTRIISDAAMTWKDGDGLHERHMEAILQSLHG